jgi:hypothetical protein
MGRLIGGSGSSFGMMFGGRGWKREMEGVLEERRGESVGRSVCEKGKGKGERCKCKRDKDVFSIWGRNW